MMRGFLFSIAVVCFFSVSFGSSLTRILPTSMMKFGFDHTDEIQALVDSMAPGETLKIPAGILVLKKPLLIKHPNFCISGIDANLTYVIFTSDQDGIIFQNQSSFTKGGSVRVADMSILTFKQSGGAAIKGLPFGKVEVPNLFIDRVIVDGYGKGFWTFGCQIVTGAIQITDCDIRGVRNGKMGTDTLVDYSGKTGGGGRIQMIRCRMSGAERGVRVHKTDSEGQKFYDCVVEDVQVGAERLTAEPTFQWMGCRISAIQNAFVFEGVRDTAISGCGLSVSDPNGQLITMAKRQTQHIALRGNIMSGANILTVPSQDRSGSSSKKVSSISFTANFIEKAKTAFSIIGSEAKGFSFGGNLYRDVSTKFSLAGDAKDIYNSKLEK